ncbi:DinB family protein [Longimicrobium sp.]|uniref:DinB family protein n=1 Tax=Longimicrobium sp. TaxID=2029185 RepID=UPI002E368795|nr:DinB family protein [Longimicrobium sp.]HEX6039163.1 DinB family protein [Longimicrobium sp.]
MPDLSRQVVLRAVMPILAEAYAGPADPRSTNFVNNAPDCGVFGTLDGLSAAQASTPPAPGRSTAAAHAEHLRFSLDVSNRWLRGDDPKAHWPSSWAVQTVDEEGWMRLRERLRDEYAQFLELIDARAEMDEELLGGIVGTVAHAAYHLGALRQVAELVSQSATAAGGTAS